MAKRKRLTPLRKAYLADAGIIGAGVAGTALGHPEVMVLVPMGAMGAMLHKTTDVALKKQKSRKCPSCRKKLKKVM